MDSQAKKLAVLHQLSQETEAISLPELLEKLGSKYIERSVRRWLVKMVKDGLVEKQGSKRSTKYKVIQRSVRQAGTNNHCFGTESKKIIPLVRRPIYEREPVTYVDEWFDSYQQNI